MNANERIMWCRYCRCNKVFLRLMATSTYQCPDCKYMRQVSG